LEISYELDPYDDSSSTPTYQNSHEINEDELDEYEELTSDYSLDPRFYEYNNNDDIDNTSDHKTVNNNNKTSRQHNHNTEILSRFDRRNVFPQVYPTFNKRPVGKNACDFDPSNLTFSNDCKTSWDQLWEKNPDVVELVKKHFSYDFKVLGYTTDWRNVMPLH